MTKESTKCIIDTCEEPEHIRGLCLSHYNSRLYNKRTYGFSNIPDLPVHIVHRFIDEPIPKMLDFKDGRRLSQVWEKNKSFHGVYLLYKGETLLYVGQGTLPQRILEDWNSPREELRKNFDKVEYCEVSDKTLRLRWESFLNWKYTPSANRTRRNIPSFITDEKVWNIIARSQKRWNSR